MNAFENESSPALHNAQVRLVDCPPGPSSAEFLLATYILFISARRFMWGFGEEGISCESAELVGRASQRCSASCEGFGRAGRV